jgi:hypothetical protein
LSIGLIHSPHRGLSELSAAIQVADSVNIAADISTSILARLEGPEGQVSGPWSSLAAWRFLHLGASNVAQGDRTALVGPVVAEAQGSSISIARLHITDPVEESENNQSD